MVKLAAFPRQYEAETESGVYFKENNMQFEGNVFVKLFKKSNNSLVEFSFKNPYTWNDAEASFLPRLYSLKVQCELEGKMEWITKNLIYEDS